MSSETSQGEPLAATARWMAAIRAHESEQPNPLFADPLAHVLAGEEGKAWLERVATQQQGDPTAGVTIRVRYFDDFLLRATHEQGIRQIVLVAAGMDTRAFRLDWLPQTHLFEMDQPEVFTLKERLLLEAGAAPSCERHTIDVDLRGSLIDDLPGAGFDQGQPAAWLLEGLLLYLPEEAVSRLLTAITALSASGSCLGFDVMNSDMFTSPWTRDWVAQLHTAGVTWHSAMDDPEAVLAPLGWTVTVVQPGEERANYGRWPYPVLPLTVPGIPRNLFVTATR